MESNNDGKGRVIPVPGVLQRKVNPGSILRHVEVPEYIPRVRIQEVPVEVRRHSFTEEVKASITDVQALLEAGRGLQCGSICYDREFPLKLQLFYVLPICFKSIVVNCIGISEHLTNSIGVIYF